jgi:hypothetical protein
MDRLALLPPEAARLVGEELAKLGAQREALRARLGEADSALRITEALLEALGNGRRFLVLENDPGKRGRILGRAAKAALTALEASSPEVVRDRIKSLIRQITVKPDGTVVVEGTYEPLVREELERVGAEPGTIEAVEKVRTTLVPGARTLRYFFGPPGHLRALLW